MDPDLDPHLLCKTNSKEPIIMRIRPDPDTHLFFATITSTVKIQ